MISFYISRVSFCSKVSFWLVGSSCWPSVASGGCYAAEVVAMAFLALLDRRAIHQTWLPPSQNRWTDSCTDWFLRVILEAIAVMVFCEHYSDVVASQITENLIVYSIACSGFQQRKHPRFGIWACVRRPTTRGIPSQRARYAEHVSVWHFHEQCSVMVFNEWCP